MEVGSCSGSIAPEGVFTASRFTDTSKVSLVVLMHTVASIPRKNSGTTGFTAALVTDGARPETGVMLSSSSPTTFTGASKTTEMSVQPAVAVLKCSV